MSVCTHILIYKYYYTMQELPEKRWPALNQQHHHHQEVFEYTLDDRTRAAELPRMYVRPSVLTLAVIEEATLSNPIWKTKRQLYTYRDLTTHNIGINTTRKG